MYENTLALFVFLAFPLNLSGSDDLFWTSDITDRPTYLKYVEVLASKLRKIGSNRIRLSLVVRRIILRSLKTIMVIKTLRNCRFNQLPKIGSLYLIDNVTEVGHNKFRVKDNARSFAIRRMYYFLHKPLLSRVALVEMLLTACHSSSSNFILAANRSLSYKGNIMLSG